MPNSMKFEGRPIWAEISLGALKRNLGAIRSLVNSRPHRGGPRKVFSIVKANAYGHGAVPVAKALAAVGADGFGVACVSEGVELREAGIRKPILVLGGFWVGEENALVRFGLLPALHDCRQLQLLERAVRRSRLARTFGFHLKVNTGMNRLGVSPRDVACFVRELAKCRHLKLQGTFTHFASSELLDSQETTLQQAKFAEVITHIESLGVPPGVVHAANSAAIASSPSTWADMVRPGAAIYGYHANYSPSDRQAEFERLLPLEPVLSLRTRIIALRSVQPGEGVGYDARFVAKKPSRIAVIAAGYADGLMRGLSKGGQVIVRGQFAPIVGHVSMDMAAVDVTAVEGSAVGDVVTLYGSDGISSQSAAQLSQCLGTVVQDVLCAMGPRVRRIYTN